MAGAPEQLPPGQYRGRRWIIYAALGIPRISAEDWRLRTTGTLENPRVCSCQDLLSLPQVRYRRSFHCVTRWSIQEPEWEGVSIGSLAREAGFTKASSWVMFHCADGYTAPVPLEDAIHPDSIVALRLNGAPLRAEQGFPARPFITKLYGWKSAKWLTEIEFIPAYRDGYWEGSGYHERASVADEERFKGGYGRHAKRRSFGAA